MWSEFRPAIKEYTELTMQKTHELGVKFYSV